MTVELGRKEPKQDAFLGLMSLVEKAARSERRIDLVTFVQDHPHGSRHSYSPLGLTHSEHEINTALSEVVGVLTPSKRSALESLIAEDDPSRKRIESHFKMGTWEWKTQRGRLVLGVEILVDDRRQEEWVRTWYVRGESKPLREKVEDTIFAFIHPIEAAHTIARQVGVAMEAELPPHTRTIEEFPNLSVRDAARAIREARPVKK